MLAETCLALAIYWEARNQPILGQEAVAEVVLNRVASPHYPNTICGVVTQKKHNVCQFAWYCDGLSDNPKNKKAWAEAQAIAKRKLTSPKRILPKNTVHFHSGYKLPYWASFKKFVIKIGNHFFYKA